MQNCFAFVGGDDERGLDVDASRAQARDLVGKKRKGEHMRSCAHMRRDFSIIVDFTKKFQVPSKAELSDYVLILQVCQD